MVPDVVPGQNRKSQKACKIKEKWRILIYYEIRNRSELGIPINLLISL